MSKITKLIHSIEGSSKHNETINSLASENNLLIISKFLLDDIQSKVKEKLETVDISGEIVYLSKKLFDEHVKDHTVEYRECTSKEGASLLGALTINGEDLTIPIVNLYEHSSKSSKIMQLLINLGSELGKN